MSKNTRNRILLTAVAALLLVTLTIGGTLAWLTATSDTVTNEFTHSEIDIILVETKNDFQMIPGEFIEKDPKVTVELKDVKEAWVFVKVEESTSPKLADYIEYTLDSAIWTAVPGYAGVYYTTASIEDEATDTTVELGVLTSNQVTTKTTVNSDMMEAISGEGATLPSLSFTAYAIQKTAASTAEDAWALVVPD